MNLQRFNMRWLAVASASVLEARMALLIIMTNKQMQLLGLSPHIVHLHLLKLQ